LTTERRRRRRRRNEARKHVTEIIESKCFVVVVVSYHYC
jgi:hypothetical protein